MNLLIDSHVHFHACFNWTRFLNAAAANLRKGRRELNLSPATPGCLIFTEVSGMNAFRDLRDDATILEHSGWILQEPGDDCSLMLSRHRDEKMMIVAGRQVVSAEDLEVLALGCTCEFEHGTPLERLLVQVVEAGAAAVIPWGFGKWRGRRGTVLRALLDDRPNVPFSLGDNGGRPRGLPRPGPFVEAERTGIAVLPGSDPLPIRSHECRAGTYGFVIESGKHEWPSATKLIQTIASLRTSPQPFGRTSSLSFAIRSQVELRLAARKFPRRPGSRLTAP